MGYPFYNLHQACEQIGETLEVESVFYPHFLLQHSAPHSFPRLGNLGREPHRDRRLGHFLKGGSELRSQSSLLPAAVHESFLSRKKNARPRVESQSFAMG